MVSSSRRNSTRGILIALLVEVIAAGCDLTAPLDPTKHTDALVVDAAQMVAGSSITASAVSWNEIDLSWPTTPSVSGYEVFRSTSGAAGPYTLITTTAATIGNYADQGLTASTQYCYEIRSFKRAGKNTTYSAFSSAACATTSPPPVAAPSETDAVPQGKLILITWKDNSANENGFAIQRAPTPNGSWVQVGNASPANSTSANVSATAAEEQVCFRVFAFNSIGPSLPSLPDCTAVPATPTYFGARVLGATIALSWADNSAVEDGYRISRLEAGGVWTDLVTLPANSGGVDVYQDVGVTTGVRYTYRIQALKDGGYSEMSNEVSARIATSLPAAPSDAGGGFVGSAVPPAFLYLSIGWTDNSSNEDGFRVQYSYYGDWYMFAETAADATSFFQEIGTGGEPQSGCFRVVAFNSLGESEPSNSFCSQAPEGLPGGMMIVISSPTRPSTGAGQRPRSLGPGRTVLTRPARARQVPRHVSPVPVIPPSL
jgi:hypothetical protein